ncbi:McrC family protein [Aeromonas simiae]|uniref:McrC family protein n=1 Tax=Aeromonas simiae TaxID=218936 RepID=UPI00266BA63E|nr:McrC family protein [Aeromonas simiae]MDO2949080.1 McrC family protein [Aeromonas simiae]MDO2956325.1 McrC family protein [Aeromonas simiae]
MNAPISIHEYGRLTTSTVASPTLSLAHIASADFDWLCQLSKRYRVSHAPALVQVEDARTLQLDNYVGIIETPSGQVIEILPKIASDDQGGRQFGRELTRRMLECSLDLPPREADEASLDCFDMPLSEWVMARFLTALDHLVKRGIRSDYQRVEANEPFLRGQLDVARQMRQPPGKQHHFVLRYDLFLPDRAENRLLKLALEKVANTTRQPDNWRLAQELRHLLTDIPASRDMEADFRQWRHDRLMAHYQPVRPWCELVLYRAMPSALQGKWRGISLLFPMEKLFERYVEVHLRQQLLPGAGLTPQAARQSLCTQNQKPLFELRPDLLLHHGAQHWVLDMKWKRIDNSALSRKYQISQGDLYQLFAYGHKYLKKQEIKHMVLIYPVWDAFSEALDPFSFDEEEQMVLWALPFKLEQTTQLRLVMPKEADSSLCLPLRS